MKLSFRSTIPPLKTGTIVYVTFINGAIVATNGTRLGLTTGKRLGIKVIIIVGNGVGTDVVGLLVLWTEGCTNGFNEGCLDGNNDGGVLGLSVVGATVGDRLGADGLLLGRDVG